MSLTGTWNLSIATPMGEQKVELELVQQGPDQISGVSRNALDGEQRARDPRQQVPDAMQSVRPNGGERVPPMAPSGFVEGREGVDRLTAPRARGAPSAGRALSRA